MALLLRTKEMAAELNVHHSTLALWGRRHNCPHFKKHFVDKGWGGSRRGTGWDPDDVRAWLRSTGRMKDGQLINRKTGKPLARRSSTEAIKLKAPAVAGEELRPYMSVSMTEDGFIRQTPAMTRYALAHLLTAFAHACQGGGIPRELQNALEDEGLGELRQEALDHIEEMAQATTTTASMWTIIKQALPALAGRAGRKK